MPTFELTARHPISRPGIGLYIERGQSYTININMVGITPNNLFNNSRCADQLAKQFRIWGIDVPKTDSIYNPGMWDIKMR